jgi:hypothetical protein
MIKNNIKILIDGEIVDAVLEDDNYFVGGKKVIYQDKDGTNSLISVSLVNIIEDELAGSPRD